MKVHYNEALGWCACLGTCIIKSFGFDDEAFNKAIDYAEEKNNQ